MPPKPSNPLEKYFGKITRYQIIVFALIFCSKMPLFWHILNLIFLSPPMNYHCNVSELPSDNSSLNKCPCDDPFWDRSVFTETMQTKFTILCDTHWLISFSQSMAYAGALIGSFGFGVLSDNVSELPSDNSSLNKCPHDDPFWDRSVFTETMQTKFTILCDTHWLIRFSHFVANAGALTGSFGLGFLSDKFGRLFIYSISCFVIGFAGSLISVMPSAGPWICMRVIEGIGVGGAIVTSYVLCIEYCGIKHREIVTALFHLPLNLGHVTLPGISYLLRDFDDFQLAISIPMFFFALMKFLIHESPKWLMDKDHVDEITSVIMKVTSDQRENIKAEVEEYIGTQKAKNTQRNVQFWEIFKHRRLTINFCCMAVIYFVCGMGYYGVSQFIGNMSGNIHVNVAISGVLLFPGTLLCIVLLHLIPRRTFLMASNILSGIFMIIVISVPTNMKWVRVIFACCCDCFFFVAFIVAFLYGVELFPTSVRSSVLGFLSVMSRLGQIVNPPINSLSETVAGATFGVFAIIGGFLCCFLPDTDNIELPSSLEDTKDMSNKNADSTEAGPSKG